MYNVMFPDTFSTVVCMTISYTEKSVYNSSIQHIIDLSEMVNDNVEEENASIETTQITDNVSNSNRGKVYILN